MDVHTAGARPGRPWRTGQWLADGSMESVVDINAQGLEFLCALTQQPAQRLPAMFAGQLDIWRGLSLAARSQLAASPCLLIEAGFDNEERWLPAGRLMVHDLRSNPLEPVFTGVDAEQFIRRVLVFAWHLARANRQLARMVLGMTPTCAERVAALRLQDLDWVVQHHPEWVRPRWEHRPQVWRHLLQAAGEAGNAEPLTRVGLRGLQLMAGGVLGDAPAGAATERKSPR